MIKTDGRYKIPNYVIEFVEHLQCVYPDEHFFIDTDRRLIKMWCGDNEFSIIYEAITNVDKSVLMTVVREHLNEQ